MRSVQAPRAKARNEHLRRTPTGRCCAEGAGNGKGRVLCRGDERARQGRASWRAALRGGGGAGRVEENARKRFERADREERSRGQSGRRKVGFRRTNRRWSGMHGGGCLKQVYAGLRETLSLGDWMPRRPCDGRLPSVRGRGRQGAWLRAPVPKTSVYVAFLPYVLNGVGREAGRCERLL